MLQSRAEFPIPTVGGRAAPPILGFALPTGDAEAGGQWGQLAPTTWKLWGRRPQLWTVNVVHFYFLFVFVPVNLGLSQKIVGQNREFLVLGSGYLGPWEMFAPQLQSSSHAPATNFVYCHTNVCEINWFSGSKTVVSRLSHAKLKSADISAFRFLFLYLSIKEHAVNESFYPTNFF